MLQVADYMRQLVETAGPNEKPNHPGSRVEHIQSMASSSTHPVHTAYASSGPRSSTANNKRVIADTADPQLHANESLHSLALQHAGVLRPPAAADSTGALRRLCNGAVCASLAPGAPGESLVHQGCADMVGARSRAPMAGSRPQTVLAELSTRLLMESRERTGFADPDGVLVLSACCALLMFTQPYKVDVMNFILQCCSRLVITLTCIVVEDFELCSSTGVCWKRSSSMKCVPSSFERRIL